MGKVVQTNSYAQIGCPLWRAQHNTGCQSHSRGAAGCTYPYCYIFPVSKGQATYGQAPPPLIWDMRCIWSMTKGVNTSATDDGTCSKTLSTSRRVSYGSGVLIWNGSVPP